MKLSVSALNSYYGPAHILFDVDLEVGAGEVVALLGRNGAGKSTTFRSLVGLVAHREGRITFEGRDISKAPTHAIGRAGLGYVPGSGASSPISRSRKTSRSDVSRRAPARRNGAGRSCSRCFRISPRCAIAPAVA
jgi:ABC-type Mn2+/Zn2+ transport system ATPase subunit